MDYSIGLYLVLGASALLGSILSLFPPQDWLLKAVYLVGFVVLFIIGLVITNLQSRETEQEKEALRQNITDIKASQIKDLEEKAALAKENKSLRAKRDTIREQLVKYAAEGEAVKVRCLKGDAEDFEKLNHDANAWLNHVATALIAFFPKSYRVQFINPPPGLPLMHSGVPDRYNALWVGIKTHIAVLRKFMDNLT